MSRTSSKLRYFLVEILTFLNRTPTDARSARVVALNLILRSESMVIQLVRFRSPPCLPAGASLRRTKTEIFQYIFLN